MDWISSWSSCWSNLLQKSLRLCHFKLGQDKFGRTILHYSSHKYALTDEVGFRYDVDGGILSFHAEKYCHLVSAYKVYDLPGAYAAASNSSWSTVHLYFHLTLYCIPHKKKNDSISDKHNASSTVQYCQYCILDNVRFTLQLNNQHLCKYSTNLLQIQP